MNRFDEEVNDMLLFDNNMSYLFFLTSPTLADQICDDGIKLKDKNIRLFSKDLNRDILDNPTSYIDKIKKTNNVMVIVGCPSDELNMMVRLNNDGLSTSKYIVPSYYILGYIDMSNYEVINNVKYEYGDSLCYK